MTAEIAILNKSAVALAADSAVTIDTGRSERKIFPSANKLFMLSKYYPVGVMIYGNATFMEINWETIIKDYRVRFGRQEFSSLKEYSLHFLETLQADRRLFPDSQQEVFFKNSLYYHLDSIRRDFFDFLAGRGDGSMQGLGPEEIFSELIKRYCNVVSNSNWLRRIDGDEFGKDFLLAFDQKYRKIAVNIIEDIFEETPLTVPDKNKLLGIMKFLYFRDIFSNARSGIVFTGFGKNDVFPGLEAYIVDGIVENTLRFICTNSTNIGFDLRACIIPFAQSEMVCSFMEGIDPYFKRILLKEFEGVLKDYSHGLLDILLPELGKELSPKIELLNQEIYKKYRDGLERFRQEYFSDPIISIVETLPKVELAEMAESLVNITKFKRKVSSEAETVGGPIDVAVISRDDGFVWIKRKHYFEKEYNQHYFYNYYREDDR